MYLPYDQTSTCTYPGKPCARRCPWLRIRAWSAHSANHRGMHTVKTGKLSVLPQVPQGRKIRPKEKSWGTEWRSLKAPPSSIKYAPFRSSRKHLWTSLNMLPGKRTAGVSLAAHQAQELVAVAGLGKLLQQRPGVERLGNGLHPARARPPPAARASFPPPRA